MNHQHILLYNVFYEILGGRGSQPYTTKTKKAQNSTSGITSKNHSYDYDQSDWEHLKNLLSIGLNTLKKLVALSSFLAYCLLLNELSILKTNSCRLEWSFSALHWPALTSKQGSKLDWGLGGGGWWTTFNQFDPRCLLLLQPQNTFHQNQPSARIQDHFPQKYSITSFCCRN